MLSRDPKKRQEMIRLALKEKAPRTYQMLKGSRRLEKFLKNHDAAMMEDYDPGAVMGEMFDKAPEKQDYLKTLSKGYQAIAQLDEQTLATWLEFADPPITEPE